MSRLGRRLAFQLGLLALAIALAIAAFAWFSMRRSFDDQQAARLTRRLDRAERLIADRSKSLGNSLEELEPSLRRHALDALRRLQAGRPLDAAEGNWLARLAGVKLLEIIDEGGRVLVSATWPEQVGLAAGPELHPARDGFEVIRRADPGRPHLALSAWRIIDVGSTRLTAVVGQTLGTEFVERVADGEAAVLEHSGAGPLQRLSSSRRATDDWLSGRRSLDAANAIVVAVNPGPSRERLRELQGRLAIACVVAGVAGALVGAWLGRQAGRPVTELVRAVDSIAAGEADYTFDRVVHDEFGELVSAFSRLHRSLDLEQQRTRAAERVAAWRDVARRVAHEVKNPLAPIRLTVENLRRARLKAPQEFDSLFDEGATTILEEVERLRRLVGEFSEFARLPLPRRRPCRIDRLLDDVVALHAAEPGLAVDRSDDPELPEVAVDSDQLSRALGNIVGNAVQALRGTPTPRLELRTSREDRWVKIEIADNGPGLSADAALRIFEPYFTTKQEGTGLGMSITYRIVTDHEGLIEAGNRETGGARITILLPAGPAEDDGDDR